MAWSGYAPVAEFASWGSYFWPGTTVLRNLFGEHDQAKLTDLELMAVRARGAQLAADPVVGVFDLDHLLGVHRRLFADVYQWAGQLRTAPPFPQTMVKGGPSPASIAAGQIDRRMTGKPRNRAGTLPVYEPHYVSEP